MISKTRQLVKRSKYLSLIFLIMHLLGFISSIDAVIGSRTSQGAIAWVISLNTFPIIAVPSYWVLDRSKFQDYVTVRQVDESKLSYIASKTLQDKAGFVSDLSPQSPSVRAAELLADLPMLTGNSPELLIDGEATFASICKGMEQARKYILVQVGSSSSQAFFSDVMKGETQELPKISIDRSFQWLLKIIKVGNLRA